VHFSGDANASYERHVMFDHVVAPEAASLRERFEAVARSLRDLLVQRWLQTDATYDRANPKQVYYLSMEFLIRCSLTNNLTNLLVEPIVREVSSTKGGTSWTWRPPSRPRPKSVPCTGTPRPGRARRSVTSAMPARSPATARLQTTPRTSGRHSPAR
jgi:hypothetical protein